MGVQGLWSILDPTSKPIRIETLRGKRMAIDASIWLYQFMKAMRDMTGETIYGSHLVGFVRRICKLLFHGIKPIFVFDGGVPELKSATIRNRRERKQKAQVSVEKVAEKVLKAQMTVIGLENVQNSFSAAQNVGLVNATTIPDEYELPTEKERELLKLDPRLATEHELFDFIETQKREIDFGKVDINSVEFQALPIDLQHEIILDLKNKSRAPNQHRVESMLSSSKTALDFSKSQIKNLVHRATLTDRYHNTLKSGGGSITNKRVAGSRQRDFVLIKQPGRGWEMNARQKDDSSKIVVDLTGLEGFSSIKSNSDNPFISHDYQNDYVADDISLEDIISQLDTVEDLNRNDLYSYLDQKPNSPMSTSQNDIPTSHPYLWANYWKKSVPHNFSDTYPNYKDLLIPSIVEKDSKTLNELIRDTKDKLCNNESDLHHQYYLDFLESALLMKSSKRWESSNVNLPNSDSFKNLLPESKAVQNPHESLSLVSDSESDDMLIPMPMNASTSPKTEILLHSNENIHTNQVAFQNSFFDEPYAALVAKSIEFAVENDSHVKATTNDVIDLTCETQKISDSVPTKINNEEIVLIGSSDDSEEWEAIEPQMMEVSAELPHPVQPDLLEPNDLVSGSNGNMYISEEDDVSVQVLSVSSLLPEDISQESVTNIVNIDVPELQEDEINDYVLDLQPEKIQEMLKESRSELIDLYALQRKEMQGVGDITSSMVIETQQLLKLFGIPFIIAPMEAESQCAYMMMNNLIDGIVTDDSDVFLFGGDNVYKNMFDSKKYIESFTMAEIGSIGLSRQHLIQMAYLMGSDYTNGIRGLGPVSAVEVTTTWEGNGIEGLERFKKWVAELQSGNIDNQETGIPKRLQTQLQKVEFPINFPDPGIYQAYMSPVVDESLQSFEWGEPHLEDLRDYLGSKLNWAKEKVDNIIIPVIKELRKPKEIRQTQLEQFFSLTPKKHKSTRVQNATRGGRNKKRKS